MKIGIIGSDGIPARYGGFETFVEQVAPRLADQGHHVIVVGSGLGRAASAPVLPGIEVINLPLSANGAASIVFDVLSFLRVQSRVDAFLILGVSAGLFVPLFRMVASNRRIVVNVDGLEARRAKWKGFRRWFLAISERIAVKSAHGVVSDNEGIAEIVIKRYRRNPVTIAYGHDHVEHVSLGEATALLARHVERQPHTYCLSIARIEPENNIALMIDGFLASGHDHYVVLGNFASTEYGRQLKRHHLGQRRLTLLDATYDSRLLAALRGNCVAYLHGHSVGGTNPSLVEMLPYQRPIIAFDCTFNRCTLRQSGGYFSDANSLTLQLGRDNLSDLIPPSSVRMDPTYTWEHIARQYVVTLTTHGSR